jgi:hypothetical protein
MLKHRATLIAVCLALFIVAICGNERSSNAVAEESNMSASRLASRPAMPLAQSSPQTVRVRLTEVETNADVVDWPSPGSEIIIKAGATTLNKQTDEDGVVVFDAVPCGQQIVITRKSEVAGEDGVFHRRLTCAGRQVDFGIIERTFGGKFTLRQRKLQRMGFDATKNVWRNADGKIISMRTFNRIMARRK